MSWCDLDLTFDLAVVTLTYKIFYPWCLDGRGGIGVGVWVGRRMAGKSLSNLYLRKK